MSFRIFFNSSDRFNESLYLTLLFFLEGDNLACAVIIAGGGGSSIVKVPGDVPPARVYFFGLLV